MLGNLIFLNNRKFFGESENIDAHKDG